MNGQETINRYIDMNELETIDKYEETRIDSWLMHILVCAYLLIISLSFLLTNRLRLVNKYYIDYHN